MNKPLNVTRFAKWAVYTYNKDLGRALKNYHLSFRDYWESSSSLKKSIYKKLSYLKDKDHLHLDSLIDEYILSICSFLEKDLNNRTEKEVTAGNKKMHIVKSTCPKIKKHENMPVRISRPQGYTRDGK